MLQNLALNEAQQKAIEQFAFLKALSPVSVDGYNNFKNKGKVIHTRHNIRCSIYEEFLKDFCNQFEFFADLQRQFDIISRFYIEFLSYVYNQACGNIILTQDHIKDFMCRVASVNKNSIILDTCTGTGGFLIKSMQIMFDELEQEKQFTNENKEKVKNNLIGVERLSVVFSFFSFTKKKTTIIVRKIEYNKFFLSLLFLICTNDQEKVIISNSFFYNRVR